jgi:nucleotide-binding universal stress UspA family protein
MFKRILFCVDFSPYTEKILSCSGELADAGMEEALLLHVTQPGSSAEREALEAAAEEVRAGGLQARALAVSGERAGEILRVAREEDASLIYMGGHGRGFMGMPRLGSVTRRVLREADRPVLVHKCVIRKETAGYSCENVCELLFENVLVAADFSRYPGGVLPLLEDFVISCCSRITLLHVQEEGELWGLDTETINSEEAAERNLEKLKELASCLEPHCEYIGTISVMGNPASSTLEVAREMRASLLVIGSFRHKEGLQWLLGGVAEEVVRVSEIPVLVMRGSEG